MASRISLHQVRVYEAVRKSRSPLTANKIAEVAKVSQRTARLHCLALAKKGVFLRDEIFGGFLYRFQKKSEAVEAAKSALGIQ